MRVRRADLLGACVILLVASAVCGVIGMAALARHKASPEPRCETLGVEYRPPAAWGAGRPWVSAGRMYEVLECPGGIVHVRMR